MAHFISFRVYFGRREKGEKRTIVDGKHAHCRENTNEATDDDVQMYVGLAEGMGGKNVRGRRDGGMKG